MADRIWSGVGNAIREGERFYGHFAWPEGTAFDWDKKWSPDVSKDVESILEFLGTREEYVNAPFRKPSALG